MNGVVTGLGEERSGVRRDEPLEQIRSAKAVESDEAMADEAGGQRGADEWTTASLAHASIVLTLILALAGGIGALIGVLVPLVIYLSHRERSRFVAFHALQALAYQGVGIVVYGLLVVVLAGAVVAAWTISGVLSAVVIGFFLMPLALLITLFVVALLLGVPLVWVVYGLYGAYRVYQGDQFRYWLLGEWVEGGVRA